ncbi:MAG: S8 family serine peptidase [bacterium]
MAAGVYPLKRQAAVKPVYNSLPDYLDTDRIVLKLQEGIGRPDFSNRQFQAIGDQWDQLNEVLADEKKCNDAGRYISVDLKELDRMRTSGSSRSGTALPDLGLYYEIAITSAASVSDRLVLVADLNGLEIVEIAYFPAIPQLPLAPTPNWEAAQNYLQAAPSGIDAYYAWTATGGKGDGIKVIDIEGNWVESHEDLHGGTDHFHIAGSKVIDPGWWDHGTAVLGEIAADSNSFGMTGIAFNVDLGTVSIGSMSISSAITTAAVNCDTGDVILIELQIGGPNGGAYVPVEYEQAAFDAILTATSNGRIIVEAGANGAQNLDDTYWYGHLFDPSFRFSGAIMVGASDGNHYPASFTDYGQRMDAHAYGTWNVFTLGYGDLYGTDTTNEYTASFAGTSSASPIITGACAALQGINKATHGTVLDHNELRTLLQDYSTPQAPSSKNIGPMPDMAGSVDQLLGVSFYADTTFGWVPVDVNFTASSGLVVDTWTWVFGDDDSAFIQNPAHTYDEPGMFTVAVEINAGGDIRSAEKPNYIIALADSLTALDTVGYPDSSVVVTINARNTVPMRQFRIPVEFPGTLELTFDSFSTLGCRTDYFETQTFTHFDPANKRLTVRLESSSSGTSTDLSPGNGAILKLHFGIPAAPSVGDTAAVMLDGYDTYTPDFSGYGLVYQPFLTAATVSLCQMRGDLDGGGITVSDITYLVGYLFQGGPPPAPLKIGDVDCSGGIDVADLTYLVQYIFASGPPPCSC